MGDKRLFNDVEPALATRPGAACAFLILYRIRRAALRQQSMDLYRRYGQVIVLLLALFGIVLKERPGLLAEPLLHFWRAPGQPMPDLAFGLGWMALVAAWTSIHGPFIRASALARYSRSLPLPRHTLKLVDLSILALSLPVFLVPLFVALWIAGRSGQAFGVDGRFPLYLLLFAALTIATAQAVAFGPRSRARLAGAGILAALVAAPWLPSMLLAPVAVAALVATAFACMAEGPVQAPGAARLGMATSRPARLILLRVQGALLFHRHRYDAAMRLLLAALPQLAAWWMIVHAGKAAQARGFLHVGCALTLCFTSGYFYTLHVGGQNLAPWLRSMPFGRLRMALASQLLVLGTTALLFGATLAGLAFAFDARHAVTIDMAWAAAYWLAWLPPLGLPALQRHKDSNLFKYALVAAALVIAFSV